MVSASPAVGAGGSGNGSGSGDINNDTTDLLRLVVSTLHELGLEESAQTLMREGGVAVESKGAEELRAAVADGQWAAAEASVALLGITVPGVHESSDIEVQQGSIRQALFLLRRTNFLELLASNQPNAALATLRTLAPLAPTPADLHALAALVMAPLSLVERTLGPAPRDSLLASLQPLLPPGTLVAPHRLRHLLAQAIQLQVSKCEFHAAAPTPVSLFQDHVCDRSVFPSRVALSLKGHLDEVWFVAFDHTAARLASTSKDCNVLLWDSHTGTLLSTLTGHTDPVSYCSWSPDDTYILTASSDYTVRLWNTRNAIHIRTFSVHTDSVSAVAFLPCGRKFLSGSVDKSLILWSISGEVLHRFPGARITDLALAPDGSTCVAVCHEKKLRIYDLALLTHRVVAQESEGITSVQIDASAQFVILNLSSQEIHLWDLTLNRLVRKFTGQKQGRFVIRSTFGGFSQNLIMSGSEDGIVYVWNRDTGTLIEKLPGHDGCVNCVSWGSDGRWASASDDKTVKIWSSPKLLNTTAAETAANASSSSNLPILPSS